MDLHKLYTQSRNIIQYKFGGLKSFRPSVIWLELTNFCNIKCKMCPHGNGLMTRKKGMMDPSLLEKIIDEVKGWHPTIKLFHMGESLLHPQFGSMLKYVSDAKCPSFLNTNATLLNEEKARIILDSGLDYLSLSFDGSKKEVYEKMRVGSDFDNTLKNIINFLEMKKKGGYEKPFVILEMIRMEDTEKDISNFLSKFNDFPVDKIRIKKLNNWAGKLDVKGEFKKVYSDMSCIHPWSFSVVLWDGRVVPCCRDFNGDYVLGDVTKERLIDIWNRSAKMRKLRQGLSTRRGYKGMDLCRDCSEIYTNWLGF